MPGLQVNFHSINITDPRRISFQISRIEDIPFGEGENPFLKLTDAEKEQVQHLLSNCLLLGLPGGSATMRHERPWLCAHACWPLVIVMGHMWLRSDDLKTFSLLLQSWRICLSYVL